MPTIWGYIDGGHGPELLGVGRLGRAVGTLAETYDHDAASVGAVYLEMDILSLGGELKGFIEVDAYTEGVAAIARALYGEDSCRGVGLIDTGVGYDGVVALELACTEGSMSGKIVTTLTGCITAYAKLCKALLLW